MTVTVDDGVRQNREANEGVAANRSTRPDLDSPEVASCAQIGSHFPDTV